MSTFFISSLAALGFYIIFAVKMCKRNKKNGLPIQDKVAWTIVALVVWLFSFPFSIIIYLIVWRVEILSFFPKSQTPTQQAPAQYPNNGHSNQQTPAQYPNNGYSNQQTPAQYPNNGYSNQQAPAQYPNYGYPPVQQAPAQQAPSVNPSAPTMAQSTGTAPTTVNPYAQPQYSPMLQAPVPQDKKDQDPLFKVPVPDNNNNS